MAVRREIPLSKGQQKFVQCFAAIGGTLITLVLIFGTGPVGLILIPVWAGFIVWIWQRIFQWSKNKRDEENQE